MRPVTETTTNDRVYDISCMRRAALFLVLLYSIVSSAGCNRPLPDTLIVLPGARGLEQHYSQGMEQVAYELQARYPATDSIQKVQSTLASKGWVPQDYEFMHPDRPTSNLLGWTFFEDKRIGSTRMVYEWLGEWKDKNNNIVRYSFRYVDPVEKYQHKTYVLKPSSASMIVTASYTPRKLAVATRQSEQQRLKRFNKGK